MMSSEPDVERSVATKVTDSNGPADNQSLTTAYAYNADSKPATSRTTVAPGSTAIFTTYYYQ